MKRARSSNSSSGTLRRAHKSENRKWPHISPEMHLILTLTAAIILQICALSAACNQIHDDTSYKDTLHNSQDGGHDDLLSSTALSRAATSSAITALTGATPLPLASAPGASSTTPPSSTTTTTTTTTTATATATATRATPTIAAATLTSSSGNGTLRANSTRANRRVSPSDVHNFRLEYNKFRILSHLSITGNLDQMAPDIDADLRDKLVATTAFHDQQTGQSATRRKRSLSCEEVKSDKDACCMENFYVNFTHIGWDKWILYPAGYNANYCRGQCDLSHARYYHSTLLSKYSNLISLCCSPKQMAPLRLLYIDEENKVHQKSIPDMIVESCDCA